MLFATAFPCATPSEWQDALPAIRAGRYGVIETSRGKLVAMHLRLWPTLLVWPELWPTSERRHGSGAADRCLLYYNQPRRHSNYIALKYVETSYATSYATFRAALTTLDAVAAAKGTDALLCDVANGRISDRLLARLGWQAHKAQRWHRNFIKRYYGSYPVLTLPLAR
jgi:hypothetical protein